MKPMAKGIWVGLLAGMMFVAGCASAESATPAAQAWYYEAPVITVTAKAPVAEAALRYDAPTIVVSARAASETVALRYDAPTIHVTARAPREATALYFEAPTITVSSSRAAQDGRLAGTPTPTGSLF
jgi:hypothetical protein